MVSAVQGTPSGASTRSAVRLAVPESVLVDALAVLAAARTRADVAADCLPLLVGRPGVRAAAIVQRDGPRVVVLGSAGYDCGSMAAGADLPLDAGLPVTEAVRTGKTVVQGTGPGWLAVPFGGSRHVRGALLLSLHCAPPEDDVGLGRLHRLSEALGEALQRTGEHDRDAAELAVVTATLTAPVAPVGTCQVVQRSLPIEGTVGGDVLLALPDGRSGTWLLAADVCGYGLAASLVAGSVRTAARACTAWADGPAQLLAAIEDAVAPDVPPGGFVTAVAVHLPPDGGPARVASAGHPAPLLLVGGHAVPVVLEPAPPLALDDGRAHTLTEVTMALPPGAAVLLHTDGLTDRRVADGVRQLDPQRLASGLPDDLGLAADRLLAAAEAVGPAQDDVSLLLARP